MTPEEARTRLGLAGSNLGVDDVPRAYVKRVRAVKLDADVDGFVNLRRAFETAAPHLQRAPSARQALLAARDTVTASPRSADARWNLLSLLPYAFDAEASAVVLEGARLEPDEFLDELLLHFPALVPPELLDVATARTGSPFGRTILVARVHAEQGRTAAALDALAVALPAASDYPRPLTLRLALGVIFALQATARDDAATIALGMITGSAPGAGPDDHHAETILAMARELDLLKGALPLELRQAAARAAQRDDLANLPYAARFATRNLDAGVLREVRRRLRSDGPVLSRVLALDLSEEQLRPAGTPNFRYAIGVGAFIPLVLLLIFTYKRFTRPAIDVDKMLGEVHQQMVQKTLSEACADPNSDFCKFLVAQAALAAQDGGQDAGQDAGKANGGGPDAGPPDDDSPDARRPASTARHRHHAR